MPATKLYLRDAARAVRKATIRTDSMVADPATRALMCAG